jgi:hypothetical protein
MAEELWCYADREELKKFKDLFNGMELQEDILKH